MPDWARVGGYTETEWVEHDGTTLDAEPCRGRKYRLHAWPPFEAAEDSPFFTLWVPALALHNGWQPDDGSLLQKMRVVQCRLLDVLSVSDRRPGGVGRELLVEAISVEDPMSILRSSVPVDTNLQGCFLDAREEERSHVHAEDRQLCQTTMEGDINFDFLLDPACSRVALVVDRSQCRGFFWCGHGRLDESTRRALK